MSSSVMMGPMPVASFRSDLAGAMGKMRGAFVALLREMGDPGRPTDLQKGYGIPYATCWHVFRIARSQGAVGEATKVPTPAALKKLLEAARRAGVSEETVSLVRGSAEEFRKLVDKHAGSRETFDSMIAGVVGEAGEASEAVDFQNRRTMYQCASRLWGAQIGVMGFLSMMKLVRDESGGERMEQVTLTSRLGVKRFRADATLRLVMYHPGLGEEGALTKAVDEGAMEKYGAPLMREFCSAQMPHLKIRQVGNWMNVLAESQDVGLRSSSDFSFGWVSRGLDFSEARRLGVFLACTSYIVPTGVLIQDLLVHRETFGARVPTARVVHRTADDFTPAAIGEMSALPPNPRVMALGRADEVMDTAEWPQWGGMVRSACGKVGWSLSEFDVYRVRVEYPIMHSMVALGLPVERE